MLIWDIWHKGLYEEIGLFGGLTKDEILAMFFRKQFGLCPVSLEKNEMVLSHAAKADNP